MGRFQVMALLQAARAYTLGLPIESAHSWGLNRAIFIAAAKRGFKGRPAGGKGGAGEGIGGKTSKGQPVYMMGDDMAYKTTRNDKMLFTIGGEVQTEQAYQKQVEARFGRTYGAAWKEALDYVGGFPKETLLSADGFFGDVYRPVRDRLADKWTLASQAKT